MELELLTKSDLDIFKKELFIELKRLFEASDSLPPPKWLRSYQVRSLLNISPGTLQNLRIIGVLPFKKIGGSLFYEYKDIEALMKK